MKKALLLTFFAVITSPCTLAMEKETQPDPFSYYLPIELHKEIIIKMLSATPSAIENLKTLKNFMRTSKTKAQLQNLFANQKNVIEFCFALKNSTENIFRSLYLLRVYNFINDQQFNKLSEQFKKDYPDEFWAHQKDVQAFITEFVNIDMHPFDINKYPSDINKLQQWIAKGMNVNIRGKYGATALSIAAYFRNTNAVKYLLAALGIEVNSVNNYGNNALMWAVWGGQIEIVKQLLAAGIDVNRKNIDGLTVLIVAAEDGRVEIVKLLLARPEIDVNVRDGRGRTALLWAVKHGHTEIVKLLLTARGIEVNSKDYGKTALIVAAKNGLLEIVKLLLNVPGIDVNIKDNGGYTALMSSAYWGHAEIIELLLAVPDIDVNSKDNDGKTALDVAKTDEIKRILEDFIKKHGK